MRKVIAVREKIVYPLRIPEPLYAKLQVRAEKLHCSVNSVALVLIEKGLEAK